MPHLSPYETALPDVVAALHPRLRLYFSAIPVGSVGVGEGVFDVVGTPRRWVWPALWLLSRRGILFPVWQRDVPFSIENRPSVDAAGRPSVSAIRSFQFFPGEGSHKRRDMVDEIAADGDGLIDRLGRGGALWARFSAHTDGQALILVSNRVGVRVAGKHVALPRALSPRVMLRESFDEVADRQRVEVKLSLPVFGLIYEYSGTFRYSIVPAESSEGSHTADP